MQVQHEARLLEASPLVFGLEEPQDKHKQVAALDSYCLTSQLSNALLPIEQLAGGNSGNLLAIHVSHTNHIVLFNSKTHQRCDRFPLKAYDKKYSRHSFQVTGLEFSPDGQRLAVGQTDCIIYIYKLGAQVATPVDGLQNGLPTSVSSTTNKPTTISGKFVSTSPITRLLWTEMGILFASQDGKVRLILSAPVGTSQQHRLSNGELAGPNAGPTSMSTPPQVAPKVITIFAPPPPIVNTQKPSTSAMPISLAYEAPLLLIGQLNNKLQVLLMSSSSSSNSSPLHTENDQQHLSLLTTIDSPSSRRNSSSTTLAASQVGVPSVMQTLTIDHSCPPVHLTCLPGQTICCAGSDGRVTFHNLLVSGGVGNNSPVHSTSLMQIIDLKEDIMSMDYSPANEMIALITKQRLMFIEYDQEACSWRLQLSSVELRNQFTLTAVRWLREGSQLAVAYSNCSLELFKCTWSKQAINDQLDICHIARNRVRITDRERNLLATCKTQFDIKRVNILDHNQNVLIWTAKSLRLARLQSSAQQSEIKWPIASWTQTGTGSQQQVNSKFLFEPSGFVLIYNETHSECHLLKLGDNFITYTYKLPPGSPVGRNLVTIRQFPPAQKSNLPAGSSPRAARGSRASSATLSAPSMSADESEHKQVAQQESQFERLAYCVISCTGERAHAATTIKVIDLKRDARVLWQHEYESERYNLIKFSHTSRYLYLMNSDRRKLALVSFQKVNSDDDEHDQQKIINHQMMVLTECEFADWLPETDSLVVQVRWQVKIWYDLSDGNALKRPHVMDIRSLSSFTRRAPLVDLSQAGSSTGTGSYPIIERLESDEMVLSNLARVNLDRTRRKFWAELASGRLDRALDLLDRQANTGSYATLYSKLGWLAIERQQCELATRIFTKLGATSLANYLVKCQLAARRRPSGSTAHAGELQAEPEAEDDDQSPGEVECQIMLAKLCGQWARFEQLARDQEVILSTYKRLNKWSLCLDYLNRTQQFRQRDIAELEHERWLESRARYLEVAKLRLKNSSGDLASALEFLLEHKQLLEAADLMLAEHKSSPLVEVSSAGDRKLRNLAESISEQLVGAGENVRAGQVNEKVLGQVNEALELYLKANKFEAALELAREQLPDSDPQRLKSIHLSYANYLRSLFERKLLRRRDVAKAIDNFISAGAIAQSFEMAIQAGSLERAMEIARQFEFDESTSEVERDRLLRNFRLLADKLLAFGPHNTPNALEALEKGEDFERLIELLIDEGNVARAYEVAMEKLNSRDRQKTDELFLELATGHADKVEEHQKAQAIYLYLSRPELAIEMHRKCEHYDQMLELIERHQPDQLEGSLLQLARSLESLGRLEEAEHFLLRASPGEWTNVVRMYRLANRWPDAFRVARANCLVDQDPLLVQLAYWWARSLPEVGQGGRKLLEELELLRPVIEFCCETKNFPFALDLLSGGEKDEQLRRDIASRYATHLERENKLDQAERVLIENQQVDLAARMYLDNDQHERAIQVIEEQLAASKSNQQLIDLLQSTLIECAQRLADEVAANFRRSAPIMSSSGSAGGSAEVRRDKLQRAQELFLRAKRPEMALQMYQSMGMWHEAIQVAQRHAPRLLEQVERALDEQISDDIEPILRSASANSSNQPNGTPDVGQPLERDDKPEVAPEPEVQKIVHQSEAVHEHPIEKLWSHVVANLKSPEVREALDKYLSALLEVVEVLRLGSSLDGDRKSATPPSTDSAPLLARQLQQLARLARNDSQLPVQLSRPENLERICALSSRLFKQLEWAAGDPMRGRAGGTMWSSLRDILAACLRCSVAQVGANVSTQMKPLGDRSSELAALERRLLVAHYVTAHQALEECLGEQVQVSTGSRANQRPLGPSSRARGKTRGRPNVGAEQLDIKQLKNLLTGSGSGRQNEMVAKCVDLLGKLSLSLVRYTDLIDLGQVLLAAGRWQLALGRHQLARQLWTALVEMVDEAANSAQANRKFEVSSSLRHLLANYIDLPAVIVMNGQQWLWQTGSGGGGAAKLAEIRQWLLESLIGGGGGAAATSDLSNLPAGWAHLNSGVAACLVCGLPADLNGPRSLTLTLAGSAQLNRMLIVRIDELISLLELSYPEVEQLRSELEASENYGGAVFEFMVRRSSGKDAKSRAMSSPTARIIEFMIGLATTTTAAAKTLSDN